MASEMPETPQYRIIAEQPDPNTVEVATYGSKYKQTKSALYLIDMMIAEAQKRYVSAVASCYGDEAQAVLDIYRTRPFVLSQNRPKSRNFEDMMNLQTAHSIYRRASALKTLKQMRAEVELHGALCGLQEYGDRMMTEGIDPDLIRMVIRDRASTGMLNNYESVQKTLNSSLTGDAERSKRMSEMSKMILETNEHIRMVNEYPEATEEEWNEQNSWINGQAEDSENKSILETQTDEPSGRHTRVDSSVLASPWMHVSQMDESEVMEANEDGTGIEGSDSGRPEDAELIQPASSSVKDAVNAIAHPEESETARIGPGGSTPEMAMRMIPTMPERLRIGPGGSTLKDTMDLMDAIALERPLCDNGSYAQWFRSLDRKQYKGKTYLQDDGGIVLIQAGDDGE